MTDVAIDPGLESEPGSAGPEPLATPPPGDGGQGPPPVPNFNIVPVKGLPIVAVLLIGLVVAITSNNL